MKKMILILLAGLLMMQCGSGPTEPKDTGEKEPTLDELLSSGWSAFTSEKYVKAKQYFDQALIKEAINSDANLGKGWSLLMQGSSHFQVALGAFEMAVDDQDCEADCRTGIITVKFVQQKYDEVPSLVTILLEKYPEYSFAHKSTINWQDLLLMKAQAFYFSRRYMEAWSVIKQLTSDYNHIDPDASETWLIDQQSFFSFEAVLSRIIYILSDTYK